jgi:hypothetical protein
MASGKLLDDCVPNIEASLVWADDNRTLVYIDKDPVTLLSKRVKAHVLGTPTAQDAQLYEEADESFYLSISRTRSDKYICIVSDSTVSSEVRCTPAASPGQFSVIAPRQRDVEYQADHLDGRWIFAATIRRQTSGYSPAGRCGARRSRQVDRWSRTRRMSTLNSIVSASSPSGTLWGLLRLRILKGEAKATSFRRAGLP